MHTDGAQCKHAEPLQLEVPAALAGLKACNSGTKCRARSISLRERGTSHVLAFKGSFSEAAVAVALPQRLTVKHAACPQHHWKRLYSLECMNFKPFCCAYTCVLPSAFAATC